MKPLFTPQSIMSLKWDEVFVFGSNIKGNHSGGAALFAKQHFGAKQGVGEGIQGQSYAIPTVNRTLKEMQDSVDKFVRYVQENKHTNFYLTEIGCRNAGHSVDEIASLFKDYGYISNLIFPKSFAIVLQNKYDIRPYDFSLNYLKEGFRFHITDLEKKTVDIIDGPQYGCLPSKIEFQGEDYIIENVKIHRGICNPWPSYDSYCNGCNFLAPFAFFYTAGHLRFFIPEDLEWYGHIPFPRCDIESNNDRFVIENGLVIDTKYKRVIQCVDYLAKQIEVPEGIVEIYDGAFYDCRLEKVTLPKTLKRICIDAFFDCKELTEVTLPKGLEYLGDYCFSFCFNLKTIRFLGHKVKGGEYPFYRAMAQMYVPKGGGDKIKRNIESCLTYSIIEE